MVPAEENGMYVLIFLVFAPDGVLASLLPVARGLDRFVVIQRRPTYIIDNLIRTLQQTLFVVMRSSDVF